MERRRGLTAILYVLHLNKSYQRNENTEGGFPKVIFGLVFSAIQTQSEDSSICDNVTHSLTETCVGRDEIT